MSRPGDCESEGRARERGAADEHAHALPMQTPGREGPGRADALRPLRNCRHARQALLLRPGKRLRAPRTVTRDGAGRSGGSARLATRGLRTRPRRPHRSPSTPRRLPGSRRDSRREAAARGGQAPRPSSRDSRARRRDGRGLAPLRRARCSSMNSRWKQADVEQEPRSRSRHRPPRAGYGYVALDGLHLDARVLCTLPRGAKEPSARSQCPSPASPACQPHRQDPAAAAKVEDLAVGRLSPFLLAGEEPGDLVRHGPPPSVSHGL
jgi:hypothetical protein